MNVDIYNSRTMYLFIYRYKIKKNLIYWQHHLMLG